MLLVTFLYELHKLRRRVRHRVRHAHRDRARGHGVRQVDALVPARSRVGSREGGVTVCAESGSREGKRPVCAESAARGGESRALGKGARLINAPAEEPGRLCWCRRPLDAEHLA